MNTTAEMTNRDKVRKVLGITAFVLIIGGPYVAADDYQATSRSRRAQGWEEWFVGLQSMFGGDGTSSGTAIVIGWLMVVAGVGCLVGWFLLGRSHGVRQTPGHGVPQAPGYRPPQAPGHGVPQPTTQAYPGPEPRQVMPPPAHPAREPGMENTFDNPFNTGQARGGDRP